MSKQCELEMSVKLTKSYPCPAFLIISLEIYFVTGLFSFVHILRLCTVLCLQDI